MRTGAEYRESLRDGRNVWVMGEGRIDDVTTHPATAAMVKEYVAWYDRHFDPDWQDILLTEPDANGERRPWAFETPTTSDHLRRLGKAMTAVHFITAGNMTHTPGYGALIALGMLNVLQRLNQSPQEIEAAEAYRNARHIGTHWLEVAAFSLLPPAGRSSVSVCEKTRVSAWQFG